MLSPGKHVSRDVPRLVSEAAATFPNVAFRVTGAFGIHEKLAELIAIRTGVELAMSSTPTDACRCWEPNGDVGSCGAACAAKQAAGETTTAAR
jgi:hypothetical protein